MHIEQKVCEHDVMTGFERNSLHTSQRKAASRGSKAGSDVDNQSVESGKSNGDSIRLFTGVMGETGVLGPGHDGSSRVASDAWDHASRSRVIFVLVCALSATQGCRFRALCEKLIFGCVDMVWIRCG
jgi:hypothetical protein